jgi:hypothetical protein
MMSDWNPYYVVAAFVLPAYVLLAILDAALERNNLRQRITSRAQVLRRSLVAWALRFTHLGSGHGVHR